ncbi:hypothetical protein VN97_g4437 [Penicillium thymicola]|uniref:Uncharacterized protein n=1 Tax=Penicillium thymicola TaxID=293382 RepID=A0AAI9TKM5_PENTH|nr:hypothetical protein VN97_g4437 [Penicillium thymicola]
MVSAVSSFPPPSILPPLLIPRHQPPMVPSSFLLSFSQTPNTSYTTTGCGKQGFPSAQPYLSHTPVS